MCQWNDVARESTVSLCALFPCLRVRFGKLGLMLA